ncbi:hypothetical protein H2199_004618 [Coniosporium tulheliwenetii]|uniref:Uncharacterized protein n=1 Tax=Coniosporium tulheliwenetii TaxID=3383036 RepID=A0ACC2Z6U4_9PEZI|nr:hypothetical protein H2199_004618 [Cladosporium sp. JES 115]
MMLDQHKSGKKLAPKAPQRRRPGVGAASQNTSQAASQAASPAAATPTTEDQAPPRAEVTTATAPSTQLISPDESRKPSQALASPSEDPAPAAATTPTAAIGNAPEQAASASDEVPAAKPSQSGPSPAVKVTKSTNSDQPSAGTTKDVVSDIAGPQSSTRNTPAAGESHAIGSEEGSSEPPSAPAVSTSIERPAPAVNTREETSTSNEPEQATAGLDVRHAGQGDSAEQRNSRRQQDIPSRSPPPVTKPTTHARDENEGQTPERSPKRRRVEPPGQAQQTSTTSPEQLEAPTTVSEGPSTGTEQTAPAPGTEGTPPSTEETTNDSNVQKKAKALAALAGEKKVAPSRTAKTTRGSTRQAAAAASTAQSGEDSVTVPQEDEQNGPSQTEVGTAAAKPTSKSHAPRGTKRATAKAKTAPTTQLGANADTQDSNEAAPNPSDETSATTAEDAGTQGGAEAGAPSAAVKKVRKPRKDKGVPRNRGLATADGETRPVEGEAQTEGGAEVQGDAAARTQKPRKPRKKPTTPSAPEETPGPSTTADEGEQVGDLGTAPARKPKPKPKPKSKNPRKRTSATTEPNAEATTDGEAGQTSAGADRDSQSALLKKRGGRKRAETPENAEEVTVDPTQTTMFDIATERRQGQLSQREKAMREINWDEVKRKRQEEMDRDDARRSNQADVESALNEAERAQEVRKAQSGGVKMKLVNGRMVVDNSSTHIDRRAEAMEEDEDLVEVEEDDLTVRMTTRTYLGEGRKDPAERRMVNRKNKNWSEAETEAFYDALKMFGIDFFVISKLFPGKTRRHIKLKFVREERADPARVNAALVGERVPIDFDYFVANYREDQRPEKWVDPKELKAELEEMDKQDEEEFQRQRMELAEQAKNRKAFEAGGGEEEGDRPKGKGKKKADKIKAAAPAGREEDVEVLETFED